MSNAPPRYSVCLTCFNEGETLDQFLVRLTAVMDTVDGGYEIVLVDDVSDDDTLARAIAAQQQYPALRYVISLYRNSGRFAALAAAFAHSAGERLVLIDCDLDPPPEDIPILVDAYDPDTLDAVAGYRVGRTGPLYRKLSSRILNGLMCEISGHTFRDFGCSLKIIRGHLVRSMNFGPYKPLRAVTLYGQSLRLLEVPVSEGPRRDRVRMRRLISVFIENTLPLARYLGWGAFTLTWGSGAALLLLHALLTLAGWASVAAGLWMFWSVGVLALLSLVLALVVEFAVRAELHLEGRPAYLVRHIHARDPDTGAIHDYDPPPPETPVLR